MTMNAPNDETVPRHTTAMLAIILVSYFMILLDNSIIFTARGGGRRTVVAVAADRELSARTMPREGGGPLRGDRRNRR